MRTVHKLRSRGHKFVDRWTVECPHRYPPSFVVTHQHSMNVTLVLAIR
ncbi:hypothetical protein LINGRAHAP2_LOCUS36541 [Linum grandiflorum]